MPAVKLDYKLLDLRANPQALYLSCSLSTPPHWRTFCDVSGQYFKNNEERLDIYGFTCVGYYHKLVITKYINIR
mgnify:CR=1 FL=1